MYILWSGRLQGWLTRGSTYSSDQAEARRFPRDEAIEMCKRHKQQAGYGLLPVREEDLAAI